MQTRRAQAIELMTRFAERTGLSSERPPQRYLWTDAFAVCNFLGLSSATGDPRYAELAMRLVAQVHNVLGHHRADDVRTGWISGLAPDAAEAHPTAGGLRIGKPLPERPPTAPIDERLEWERDGQYFHYLTKWMHALDQIGQATGQPLFNRWARELAQTAHRAFTYAPRAGDTKRMYWKVSIDLSRPLVASMGQHDPLDGWITCAVLEAHAAGDGPHLQAAVADFAAMVDAAHLATGDPLGIGGLLVDAHRIAQLGRAHADLGTLLDPLYDAALAGLRHYSVHGDLRRPAPHRLAFRELGLAIGLATLDRSPQSRAAEPLSRYAALRPEIEGFWLRPEHRRVDSWLEHENINDVMLATSLAPDGFLRIVPTAAS